MSSAAKPAYVETGGKQCLSQPFEHNNVRFTSFLLEADIAALTALVDKQLNVPGKGHVTYHPLVNRVMAGFAQIQKAHCLNLPDSKMGWIPEIDVALWVPVAAVKKVLGVNFIERIAWFLPYVFVNNPWAFASGREIYGFPKEYGVFQLPAGENDAALFATDAVAIAKFNPATEATVQRIFDVRRQDTPTVGKPAQTFATIEEIFKDFVEAIFGPSTSITLPGLGLVVELLDVLVHHTFPLVFLKQFRDVADPTRACYQAIIEAESKVTRFGGGHRLAGDYTATVRALDSHPIVSDLGLAPPLRSTARENTKCRCGRYDSPVAKREKSPRHDP